ncbi:MAG: orotate phosphoribosyltransferase [Spirochaetia bacterium]|nr:orotate phosphoribosyltransferase [Spirochaetia bacterium]
MDLNNIDKKIIQIRKNLKNIIVSRSYRENHREMYTLASGKKSPYYFDLKQTLLHPQFLTEAAEALFYLMLKNLRQMPAAIGGLTMGADPLIYAISILSLESGTLIYPFVIRKEAKDHGSKKRIEGLVSEVNTAASIVLIDDVITTGRSTIKALLALKETGYQPTDAFCVVDRLEGGRENLAQAGIRLHSLFDLNDFISK